MTLPDWAVTRFFRQLRDPRRDPRKLLLLMDVIVITLCAVIAGANDWQQVVTFGRRRHDWLATFLGLPNGIPSHDTFERVFDRLDPHAFQACFQRWVDALTRGLGLQHLAIDGKTMRGSGNGPKGWQPLHVVSAWATDCHLSLGQVAVEAKSNEITAIPLLLELLDVRGALVTIDAMGCQKEIARQIVEQGGDDVLSVKDNQPHLLEDIQECVGRALNQPSADPAFLTHQTEEQSHGRRETRSYVIVPDSDGIRHQDEWRQLKVVGMCLRQTCVQGVAREEVQYFIGSRVMSAREYGAALRRHWGIENNLHWQLDVTFREDANRVQRRHAAENLGMVRRLALSLLRRQPDPGSLACKRFAAALDTDFLEEPLRGGLNLGSP